MYVEFWWVNLKEEDHLQHIGVDKNMICKFILKKYV
jgi:hypothetical protein